MQNFGIKLAGILSAALALGGCQTAGTSALDLRGYPNINVVPTGEIAPITPQQEYEMLAELNAALASQPVMTANDRALYEERKRRLAQIAATHAIDTRRIIEAR